MQVRRRTIARAFVMSRNAAQDRCRSRGLELDSVPSCSLNADEDGIWDVQSIQQSGHACPLSRWANSSKGTRLSTVEPRSIMGEGRRLDLIIQQPSLDPDDDSDAKASAASFSALGLSCQAALAALLVLLVLAAGGGVASLLTASSAVRPQRRARHQASPPPLTVMISPAVDAQQPISMPLSMLLTPPLAPPPLAPPPSPAHPRTPPPPPAAVEALNLRFRDGRPSKSLAEVGVVVHTFDSMEDSSEPWKPCSAQEHSCAFVRDRMSASIVSERNGIALYSTETAGLLMSGAHNKVLCVYVAE